MQAEFKRSESLLPRRTGGCGGGGGGKEHKVISCVAGCAEYQSEWEQRRRRISDDGNMVMSVVQQRAYVIL